MPANKVVAMGIALGYEKPEKPLNQFRTDRVATPQVLHIIN
ncbi:hypothetical protein [Lactiplantibacillus plantarum]|nr:hypothetical protein [Lactiplantibacillus plantarum]KZT90646.1 p-nitrobenzoate reductase [Lactiplantibacillus plantarum]